MLFALYGMQRYELRMLFIHEFYLAESETPVCSNEERARFVLIRSQPRDE
jgi:hypothetical protein